MATREPMVIHRATSVQARARCGPTAAAAIGYLVEQVLKPQCSFTNGLTGSCRAVNTCPLPATPRLHLPHTGWAAKADVGSISCPLQARPGCRCWVAQVLRCRGTEEYGRPVHMEERELISLPPQQPHNSGDPPLSQPGAPGPQGHELLEGLVVPSVLLAQKALHQGEHLCCHALHGHAEVTSGLQCRCHVTSRLEAAHLLIALRPRNGLV